MKRLTMKTKEPEVVRPTLKRKIGYSDVATTSGSRPRVGDMDIDDDEGTRAQQSGAAQNRK